MEVAVSVRPENVLPGVGTNLVSGLLARSTYLGDLVQYHVLLEGGREVMLQRQSERDSAAASWRVGERVDLSWPATAALVLAPDQVAGEEDMKLLAEG